MTDTDRVTLDARPRASGDRRTGDVDPSEPATVTVYLRRRAPLPADDTRMTREELHAAHGAGEDDLAAVRAFAEASNLAVVEADAGRRAVRLSGSLADLASAFGADLGRYETAAGATYRSPETAPSVPAALGAIVTGVFGLDDRPQAAPRLRRIEQAGGGTTYSPVQVSVAYEYPDADGSGECVALVELGGGYRSADLTTYFDGLGLATPSVTEVGVDGGTNSPSTASGADSEVMLDIEVVGATAPGATIAVYFAPNTDQGFLDAVTTAVHDTTNHPTVVSISWGGAEDTWTSQAMQQMESAFAEAATLGVTVTVAAGDGGSSDGQTDGLAHVDFPASAPHALGCGGTTLQLTASGAVASEVVWNDMSSGGGATGGGVSAEFPLPSWQASAGVPPSANPGGGTGRGVPDVAGDADPATGYLIRVDGADEAVGGTSAVAPLWAGLVARLNHALGRSLGFANPTLYALRAPDAFGDITSGNNGAYQAGPGWDACTGLGSPRGQALLAALQAEPGTGAAG